MKAAEFAYEVPKSIQDAFALKQSYGEHAQFLAGGQSLIPAMNMRLNMTECLIDLGRIPALKEIQLQEMKHWLIQ
jgi:carbon-monoxide dehydrogenase medium subunit